MKFSSIVFFVSSMLFLSWGVQASDKPDESEILAQRGKGVVSQSTFAARADKIPADSRQATLRDGNRLRDVLSTLLLRAQLEADAREAGFDKEQIVIDRMQLAAQSELAEAWVQHYVETQPQGDFEQLAREYYELNKQYMMSKEKINVSHILVSTEDRTDEEAKTLADSIVKEVEQNPASFDELVMTYSEDPSSASNKGKFFNVEKGDMVKEFEESAFALQDGEISEPVKTTYGYHIIRLDAYIPPAQMEFEEVKPQIMARERQNHEDRIKQDYLGLLSSLDVKMSEEALTEMVRRQFGEDYLESQAGENE
jgi:peptidyl-prolyl cis-trans isomerase C